MTDPGGSSRALLFTDIEGSTHRWEAFGAQMPRALALHDDAVRSSVEAHGGRVFKHLGDGMAAVFPSVPDAARGALAAQLALADVDWPSGCELRARMGIHQGPVIEQGDDFFGATVNRTARIMSAAHGGQVLVSDVGRRLAVVEPSWTVTPMGLRQLRDVAEPTELFQVHCEGLGASFPPLRTMDAYPSNLPRHLPTFIGREAYAEELLADLGSHRVLTIVGPAGMGKTRLAQFVAAEALPRYADGAWFVDISSARDEEDIVLALAAVLDVKLRASERWRETFGSVLGGKSLLVVLDNCEQVVAGAADVVESLLQVLPELTVLATSREPISVTGEKVSRVTGLGPAAAAALFCERANAARGDLQVDERDPAVGTLCARLDGVPLAIELAAARARALAPAEILDRLNDRFRLLGGNRRASERHQTLRVAIDWSYDLLDPAAQLLLDRLGVFADGFDLAAAERVCAGDGLDEVDVLDELELLIDKSFVVVRIDDDRARYRLLEMIADYAVEKLEGRGDADRVRERHARHFADLGHALAARINGGDLAGGMAAIRRDFENIRLALDWLGARGWYPEMGELTCDLALFWTTRAHAEGLRRLDELLAVGDQLDPKLHIKVMTSASSVCVNSGAIRRAAGLLSAARALSEERGVDWPAELVASQAMIDEFDGRPADAVAHCEALLGQPGALDNPFQDLAVRLRMAASLVFVRPEESLDFALDCLRRASDSGIDLFVAASTLVIGIVHLIVTGDAAAARANFQRAADMTGENLPSASVPAVCGLAILDVPDDPRAALEHVAQGLRWEMTVSEPVARCACFDLATAACAAMGRTDAAARFLAAADHLRATCGFGGFAWVDATRDRARDALGYRPEPAGEDDDELGASEALAVIDAVLDAAGAGGDGNDG